ncbi:MAG: radical SAM protein [Methanosarcinales archaeon]|nr:radical SAM protein [Methanosarcinales archaeon]
MASTSIDKDVPSLCPICLRAVDARIFQENGAVMIRKNCPDHGEFQDVYWSDVRLYEKFEKYREDGEGLENPYTAGMSCPMDCGICSRHLTGTLLAIIDLTNRCNLNCPICFADSKNSGRLYEPSVQQIGEMMQNLRSERSNPCPAVQFSGGEPTLREDLAQIISMAREMGFSQIQLATNGLMLASSLDLCQNLRKAGLNTVYMQFDGLTDETYQAARGRSMVQIKLKAIENSRRAGMKSIVLVPTVIRGVNDGQLGDIVRFAAQNLDVVRGVNLQPISFSGRIEQSERLSRRITIPDVLKLLEEQTFGQITAMDFFPIPFVAPITRFIEAVRGAQEPSFTVHPCCGAATYLFSNNGRLMPITRFIDVEGLLRQIRQEVTEFKGSSLSRIRMQAMLLKELPRFIEDDQSPDDLKPARMLMKVLRDGTKDSLREFHNRTLFLGIMHFQDLYNIDLERVQRCGIHYATPDGRIIPFCSYNVLHRQAVEARFSS